METFSAVLAEPPALDGDLPPALTVVLRRLLDKDVESRYRSIAEARADLKESAASSQHFVGQTARGTSARWRRPALAALAILIILIIGLAPILLERLGILPPSVIAPGVIRSIAVLPLDNYSGDRNQDYFAEGMTDELTADLATISQLRVISRGSVMQFKGRDRPSTPDIARKLNVDRRVAHLPRGIQLLYEYDLAGCERESGGHLHSIPTAPSRTINSGWHCPSRDGTTRPIAEGARAIDLDPLSPQVLIDAAVPFMFQRNSAAAKKLARQAAELDPTYFFPVMIDGWTDLENGGVQ